MTTINCILYPPTLDYFYMFQRPHQLLTNFSQMDIYTLFGHKSYEYNLEPGVYQIHSRFLLFNEVDIAPYIRHLEPVVYISLPAQIDSLECYNPSLVVFDSLDEPTDEFASWQKGYQQALKKADIVLATSDRLYQRASMVNPDTYLVPNGCDYDYFSRAAENKLSPPEDMKGIKGPVIGYSGAVATWCDFSLIDRLARDFPECDIVMVGPIYNVSAHQLPRRSNLHWLGLKAYRELPLYLQYFDIGIIPFRRSAMIEAVNPIKMWEYLAVGIPVVTSALQEARKYQGIVLYSEDADAFIHNVSSALNNDSPEDKKRRRDLAGQNSWVSRAQQIIDIIEKKLTKKGYGQFSNFPLLPINIVKRFPQPKGHSLSVSKGIDIIAGRRKL